MSPMNISLSNFADIERKLESDDFYADVSVASSPYSLFRRIATHAVTRQLYDFLQSDPERVDAVLSYATKVVEGTHGGVRSEKDAALCACVVVLGKVSGVGVEDFFRRLRMSKELALKWPSELATLVLSNVRLGTLRTRETIFSSLSQAEIRPLESTTTEEGTRLTFNAAAGLY
jgi:hypothetical protein